MWPERFLSKLDGDEPGSVPVKLRAFQIIFALVVCTEYWTKGLRRWGELDLEDVTSLVLVTLLCAAVAQGRLRRAACGGLALLQTWYVWSLFPMAGNHRYLEIVIAALFAVLDDERPEERRLLLRSLRWLVVLVLFYSGLQKLVHGYYFRGQFLAYSLWRDAFRSALGPLLASGELDRLVSYGAAAGDGPYVTSSPLFVAASNAVWIVEMTLGVLLIPLATRRFALISACIFMVATESVARELMFGVEFVCAILLFARTALLRRLVWPAAVFLAVLVVIRLGLLPEILFH
jgi:hypothetical protein